MKHKLKLVKRFITDYEHGYECSCGKRIMSLNIKQARKNHELIEGQA